MKNATISNREKILIVAALLIAVIGEALLFFSAQQDRNAKKNITTYEACVAAGYPILESYPEQCRISDGRTFTRILATETPTAGMANPASVHCKNIGGHLDIKDETAGQVGYCTLPSGKVCEEWALFRGECQ
jgi:putative hemolysin